MDFIVSVPSGLIHADDKDYVDPKEMARVLRSHIAHMGNINITALDMSEAAHERVDRIKWELKAGWIALCKAVQLRQRHRLTVMMWAVYEPYVRQHMRKFKGWFNEHQRAVWNSHDWDPNQTECPTCLKCGLTPISAHLWGDDEWTKHAIACGLGTVKVS